MFPGITNLLLISVRNIIYLQDKLIWTEFTISSPSVVGGFPLSQSLHDFSMSLVGLDGRIIDWYNFSLRYGNYDAIEILQGGGSSSISPGGTVTLGDNCSKYGKLN